MFIILAVFIHFLYFISSHRTFVNAILLFTILLNSVIAYFRKLKKLFLNSTLSFVMNTLNVSLQTCLFSPQLISLFFIDLIISSLCKIVKEKFCNPPSLPFSHRVKLPYRVITTLKTLMTPEELHLHRSIVHHNKHNVYFI